MEGFFDYVRKKREECDYTAKSHNRIMEQLRKLCKDSKKFY